MRRNRRRLALMAPLAGLVALSLSGCSTLELHGFLPGFVAGEKPVTNNTQTVSDLWVGSWIVLLGIGITTWGLILWAAIVYRRRRGQTGLPVQLRYNMPIEVFYTVVPLILVLGLFAFTSKDQNQIEHRFAKPDVIIDAYGHQWAWDFVYHKEDVFTAGVQAQPVDEGKPNTGFVNSQLPVLMLPVDKKVEIRLRTRDVNHSFWVIDFLYKKDMIAGQTNYEDLIPTRTGTYEGRCAELCGEYHSRMLFTVKVVPMAEYTAYTQHLRAEGDIGLLGTKYDKDDNGENAGNQNNSRPAGTEANERGSNGNK